MLILPYAQAIVSDCFLLAYTSYFTLFCRKSTKFVCIRDDCTGKKSADPNDAAAPTTIVKVNLELPEERVGDFAASSSSGSLQCSHCGEPLEEDLKMREMSTRIRVNFFPMPATGLFHDRIDDGGKQEDYERRQEIKALVHGSHFQYINP